MVRGQSSWLGFLLLVLCAFSDPARAQAVDPHTLYEQRCGRCHVAHAGSFAQESLERRDGVVAGRESGRELRDFLKRGHGKLTDAEVEIMVAHLTAVLEAGGLFRERCLICHDRAVVLARRELVLRGDRVVGRYSGRDIEIFLETHGRLDQDQITTIMEMLRRQLATQ